MGFGFGWGGQHEVVLRERFGLGRHGRELGMGELGGRVGYVYKIMIFYKGMGIHIEDGKGERGGFFKMGVWGRFGG